ncbi:MAG: dihydroorotase [Candidatus Hadarchaeum sp.]|uniref:dihydroorotase n=1 Tax=Candidatus Hadarchaeum sp. TaxID=2883567 RepID=UPI003D0D9B70
MKAETVVTNGKIFSRGFFLEAGLAIEAGKIVSIAKEPNLPAADEKIDASGNIIIPGAIDAHVHLHVPGYLHREDFANGTKAAAIGGTTTVIDFAIPGKESLVKTFTLMKSAGEKMCAADFALHAAVCLEEHIEEIPQVAKMGAVSFKHFMANPDGLSPLETGVMLDSFRKIREAQSLATVHAENESIILHRLRELKKLGRSDPTAHALSRPTIAEVEAISRAILLASTTGAPLHVFHISSERGAGLIREAKKAGLSVSGETCPHYLLFNQEDLKKFGPYLQVNPPLRTKADSEALWKALADGVLDILVTDHYAPLQVEKESGWNNIWEVEAGVPGVETRVMLTISEGYHRRKIPLGRLVEVISTQPARVFGLYPAKGTLRPGSDADLTIIDLKDEMVIKAEKLHQRADWTPFEGFMVKGVPKLTMVRGKIVSKDGSAWSQEGFGKLCPRQKTPHSSG